MGYRCTMTTTWHSEKSPKWFEEKYKKYIKIIDGTLFTTIGEFKSPGPICKDYHKAIHEVCKDPYWCYVVLLWEDGEISRINVSEKDVFIWEDVVGYEKNKWESEES